MPLHPDWKEFLELLNSNKVEYLIAGAHARALHGIPRYTRDIDIFIRPSPPNAETVASVVHQFGFGSLSLTPADFLVPRQVIQLGVEPYRIDLLTSISGVTFEEAWADRATGHLDGVPVAFLGVRSFRKNKPAAGRPKDLADIADMLTE